MNSVSVSFELYYWLPSAAVVAHWMMAGCATLVWCAAITLDKRGLQSGYTPTVMRRPFIEGAACSLLLVMLWPAALYATTKKWSRRRRTAA